MTRTEELLKLAQAATQFDWTRDSEGWVNHCDNWEAQDFISAANPENIKQLVELVRLQQANILKIQAHSHGSSVNYAWCKEAIAAFNKFEQGGE